MTNNQLFHLDNEPSPAEAKDFAGTHSILLDTILEPKIWVSPASLCILSIVCYFMWSHHHTHSFGIFSLIFIKTGVRTLHTSYFSSCCEQVLDKKKLKTKREVVLKHGDL